MRDVLLRAAIGICMLSGGIWASAAAERAVARPRPALKRPLKTLPQHLGRWVGRDEPIEPEIAERSQATECLNRVYEDCQTPGVAIRLWMNFSEHGLNLRHSPDVCLPGNGYAKVESQTRVIEIPRRGGGASPIMQLAYAKEEVVQGVGFWYYIFGEGRVERFVRGLPIASRSSHGRTTRGSGLTVEVFCPGASDSDSDALRDFSATLLDALEPILPDRRDQYYRP